MRTRTHPGEEGGKTGGGGHGAFQAKATACSRGLRWAEADVREERERHGRGDWRGEWGLGVLWVLDPKGKGHGRARKMGGPGNRGLSGLTQECGLWPVHK